MKAKIYDFTPTGNLTITFNKPIILPPIEMISDQNRRLEENSTENAFQRYQIKDVLQLSVESSYHDQDDPEISIEDYRLTRLTEKAMDVQIDFVYPKKITLNEVDPDFLSIQFKEEVLFIDKNDFTLLQDKLKLEFPIRKQLEAEEQREIEELGDQLASSYAAFSIGNLGLNIFLSAGLKYLWGMIALLQFVLFMTTYWFMNMPQKPRKFLTELKSLALLEFIDTQGFESDLKDWLGMAQDEEEDFEEG